MKEILVTGGTGFLGRPLVKKLSEAGHHLKLLVRETSDTSCFEGLDNVEYVIGDVTDMDSLFKAVENIDVLCHLAAYTRNWSRDKKIWEKVNVIGTENIAKIALEKKIRLVYASSFMGLGVSPKNCAEPVDETHDNDEVFTLDYGKSKYKAKKIVEQYIEKGLNACMVYPTILYGPGDFNVFGQILHDIVAGSIMAICPGKGDSVANFVYVNDVAEGIVTIIEKEDLNNEHFILGGENIVFNDWLNLIAEIAGTRKPRHIPMSVGLSYGRMCSMAAKITKRKPLYTRGIIKNIKYNREYSSEKAVKQINYKITPLKEAMQTTVEWYMDYVEANKKKKKKATKKEKQAKVEKSDKQMKEVIA